MLSPSAEVLNDLRALIAAESEAQALPPDSPKFKVLEERRSTCRRRLPVSILSYHDARRQQKLPTLGTLTLSGCSHCGASLPREALHSLQTPGSFAVCPGCGILVHDERPRTRRVARTAAGSGQAATDAVSAKPQG